MRNVTQFQTTPGFGNFTPNTGTTTYGYPLGGTTPYGMENVPANFASHLLMQAVGNILGIGAPTTDQGVLSSVFQGQALLQSLFSENGLVLGPISAGANSFHGTHLETGQLGAISRFINLVQGVSSAQAITYTGIAGGLTSQGSGTGFGAVIGQGFGTGTGQGFGAAALSSLINVRYFDTPSAIVIECAIVGENLKNLTVTVVGEEIRIQKNETTTSTDRNLVNAGAYGNTSTYYYSLPLPNSADANRITAVAQDGILTITLPKTQEINENVHQITVK